MVPIDSLKQIFKISVLTIEYFTISKRFKFIIISLYDPQFVFWQVLLSNGLYNAFVDIKISITNSREQQSVE